MSTSDEGSAVDRAIGGRVAWFMRSAGGKRRTQAELGEFLHLDQSAVSKKLRGERPFTLRELYAVAAWLERPIGSIVTEPDQLGEPPVLVPRVRRQSTYGSEGWGFESLRVHPRRRKTDHHRRRRYNTNHVVPLRLVA